jgi:hypothetical protein
VRTIERYSAARHDHVEMRMMGHRRAPSVEHGGDADAGAEMLWIGSDGEQCLGRRAEQQIVDHRLVLVGDRGDRGRQGEDQMEIADREQVGLARGKPVLCRCPGTWGNSLPLRRHCEGRGRLRQEL